MNKRSILIISASIFGVMGISFGQGTAADSRFNSYKEHFVEEMWKKDPAWASTVGYHKYDDMLLVPDEMSRTTELAFCKANLDSLKRYPLAGLSDGNKTDHRMIENQLKYREWAIKDLRAWEWDPSIYNVSGGFADLLNNDFEDINKRLRTYARKLKDVPAYYEAARRNIKNPVRELTLLAAEQNAGGVPVFTTELRSALEKSSLETKEKEEITEQARKAVMVIKEFVGWLREQEKTANRSFRLGKDLYARKFSYEIQSGYTPEQIYEEAVKHKDELHEKMFEITQKLWPKYFSNQVIPANKQAAIKMMIDELSQKHVAPDSFQAAIEHQIPQLVEFIKKKDLIYIDPSKPLVVRREPEYMAGVAGASITSPGPYEKNGNTYYNVGSLQGWDGPRAESYLREYNHYILQILNIHEAIPGHYTQLVYANRSPSIIKSILGNNAMIEGWAVYTERMMLENGYDGDKGVNSTEASPEMWLMYYKWNLRSTCNTILDISVHTRNMSKEDALKLLVDEAFQQQAEAEGKWKRVTVTQVQLCCYFTGYTEIYNFREEQKRKLGAGFNLKQFHEQFLGYGSAPVKYIKELMTNGH